MQGGESSAEKLPLDLHEKIAMFLPLASLCRFRAVSKEWNEFISRDPDFAKRHARASSPEEYVLISERDVDLEFSTARTWVVLDVASKRSFILSYDFLAEFVKQEEIPAPCPRGRLWRSERRTILAADGGLLCLSYYVYHGSITFCELGTHEALLVCNPVLKTVKQLPHFAGWSERPEWVVMSTDRDSTEYEIFFITLAEDALQPSVAYVYESKEDSWRASVAVLEHPNTLSGRRKQCSPSVVLKDEFYALFFHRDRLRAGLVSYNKVTGAISDLGIDVPCDDDHHVSLQLVVSDGRLFCMIINTNCPGLLMQVRSIKIVEFILARRECIHLSILGSKMLNWFVSSNENTLDSKYTAPAVATGLANFIFLCSFAGRSVAYSLSTKRWRKYLDCRGGRRFSDLFGSRLSVSDLFGSNLSLSLCSP